MRKHQFLIAQVLLFIQLHLASPQDTIQDYLKTNIANVRLRRASTCAVTQEAVSEILDTIADASLYDVRTGDSRANSDTCQTALSNIKGGVLELKDVIMKLSNTQLTTSAFRILELKYLLKSQEIKAEIESLFNVANAEDRSRISDLEKELKTLQDKAGRDVEKINRLHKDQVISKCIREIDNYEIEAAVKKCGQLDYDDQIKKIIKGAYKNVQSIEKILQFVRGFPRLTYRCKGYEDLLNEMKNKNHLNKPAILTLSYIVKSEPECFENLKKELELPVDEIITKWSNNIKSGNYGRIKEFQTAHELVFASYLDQLIKNAYDADHFEATLGFINGLYSLDEKGAGFTSLFNAMKEKSLDTPNIFRIAYYVKEIMDGKLGGYLNQPKAVIDRFEALKNNLPPSVKAILWNTVLIKNRNQNEYLFAATEYPYDDDRRRIFTWRQKGTIVANSEWKLDTINEGRSFRIKSVRHKEYIYPADYAPYDDERRRVFTWRRENEIDQTGEWLLEPIKGATAFELKSVFQNEYIYAAADDLAYDSDRRRVFTWRYKGVSASAEGVWEITAF